MDGKERTIDPPVSKEEKEKETQKEDFNKVKLRLLFRYESRQ